MTTLSEAIKKIRSNDLVKVVINKKFWIFGVQKNGLSSHKYYRMILERFWMEVDDIKMETTKEGRLCWKIYISSDYLEQEILEEENRWYEYNFIKISYRKDDNCDF